MDINDAFNILKVKFNIKGKILNYKKITSGHINYTYYVIIKSDDDIETAYIFQRINDYVFKEPKKIMYNISQVYKYLDDNNIHSECKIVKFLDTDDGKKYSILDDGSFWRVCRYERNTLTYEHVENSAMLYKSGYVFGDFMNSLSKMPIESLEYTIPDFHNTKKRIEYFFDTVERNPEDRVKNIEPEIEFFKQYRNLFSKLTELQESGDLPLRIVHNDTKYNNILINKDTQQPVCVLDLDTVMPGLAMYDFGDAIRFAANTAAEDETDLSKVGLDMEYYEEFTHGFMNSAKRFLTPLETENMALGAPTITFELASRFLADYIDGDKYFRIHRPEQNLERARCQIALTRDMINKYDNMCEIVKKYR